MQYTIEARELSKDAQRTAYDVESRSRIIEASDEAEALSQYVRESAAELVSFTTPRPGAESIATIRKEDSVYLVRVYGV